MENEIIEHPAEADRNKENEECSINSRSCTSNILGSIDCREEEEMKGGDLKLDVTDKGEVLSEEIICRICHLSCSEPSSMAAGGSELIKLGCHCRGELGMSHSYCAETWFNHKGNRACEICGAMAKNVKITKKPSRIWIVDFDDLRPPIQVNSYGSSSGDSNLCRQSCCNLLFLCVVLCLLLPWFFRIKFF